MKFTRESEDKIRTALILILQFSVLIACIIGLIVFIVNDPSLFFKLAAWVIFFITCFVVIMWLGGDVNFGSDD